MVPRECSTKVNKEPNNGLLSDYKSVDPIAEEERIQIGGEGEDPGPSIAANHSCASPGSSPPAGMSESWRDRSSTLVPMF
jgi:hypothetical protein